MQSLLVRCDALDAECDRHFTGCARHIGTASHASEVESQAEIQHVEKDNQIGG